MTFRRVAKLVGISAIILVAVGIARALVVGVFSR